MISIHLRRTGAKNDAHYRVVVTDSRAARDGAFIEVLGHYHPRYEPAKVVLDVEKTKAWLDKGAQASDTVKSLLKKVESGAVETEQPVAPSRHRDTVRHAKIRAAAPEPELESKPEVEVTAVGADVEEKATADEPTDETVADAAEVEAGAEESSDDAEVEAVAEESSDDAEVKVVAEESSDDAKVEAVAEESSDDAEAEAVAEEPSDDAVAPESGEDATEEGDEQDKE